MNKPFGQLRDTMSKRFGVPAEELPFDTGRSSLAMVQLAGKVIPMFVRGLWWRMWFKHTSGLVFVGKQVTIRNPQYISAGRVLVVEDYCEIQGLSEKGITFGDCVSLGRFSMIRPSLYYGRQIGEGLRVGNNSDIGIYGFIMCSGYVEIGDNVRIGPRVSLIAENHNFSRLDVPIYQQGVTRQSIVIEDDCWLGSHSVILAGVRVGKGSIVAAGAVVTKNVPSYSIVGGVPARVIKKRDSPEFRR